MSSHPTQSETSVMDHYAWGGLITAIQDGIAKLGKTPHTITVDDLAAVDEFHIGGRLATRELFEWLPLTAADHLLDVGCGLGGTARFAAATTGCRVTGIDLTRDYVEAGTALCQWVGLDDRISVHHANALAIPFPDATFSAACMLHVGMNVEDKVRLFVEICRVLRPGAPFALYDVMREADGELVYPLPWASGPTTNALASPAEYRAALRSAGFKITRVRNRRTLALEYFARQRATASGAAAPLGLHLLMGERRQDQVHNMIAALVTGHVAPTEVIAWKIKDPRSHGVV
jgi:ubiquinone/menaquinone biosynthesis C-methylase UbiE